jgi:hypothetical protein
VDQQPPVPSYVGQQPYDWDKPLQSQLVTQQDGMDTDSKATVLMAEKHSEDLVA